jgi:hypothetical protein
VKLKFKFKMSENRITLLLSEDQHREIEEDAELEILPQEEMKAESSAPHAEPGYAQDATLQNDSHQNNEGT